MKPDDIVKKTYGLCSQQSTVLMELLQSKNLDCRPVKFPDHFTVQCRIDGKWNYFDPDLEPKILPEQRLNQEWFLNADSLPLAYKEVIAFKEKYNNRTNVIASTFKNKSYQNTGKLTLFKHHIPDYFKEYLCLYKKSHSYFSYCYFFI